MGKGRPGRRPHIAPNEDRWRTRLQDAGKLAAEAAAQVQEAAALLEAKRARARATKSQLKAVVHAARAATVTQRAISEATGIPERTIVCWVVENRREAAERTRS